MKKLANKFTLVIGAAALSAGLIGVAAMPADASTHAHSSYRDSSWGRG